MNQRNISSLFAAFAIAVTPLAAQNFVNGDFQLPGINGCNAGTGWTHSTGGGMEPQTTNCCTNNAANFWIDLTPCGGWGNGTWVEQTLTLTPGTQYSVSLNLGSFCGWDLSDAGVYVLVNGVQIGNRLVNNTFDCSPGPMVWQTVTSDTFTATVASNTIRIMGEGRCSAVSPTTGGYACTPVGGLGNPGVMGLDDVVLNTVVGGCPVDATLDTVTNVSCNGGNDGTAAITVAVAPVACSSPTVALNEILYRPSDADGVSPVNTGELIELIGPPGTNIGCYVLTDGDWTVTIPPGTTIPADGLFTIGNNAVYSGAPVYNPGLFDLDAENCACFTESTGGNSLLILTNGGEYVALFNNTGTYVQGLMYGVPSIGNTPPNGALTVGGVIPTAALGGCPASVTIPAAPYETHPGGVPVPGISLIRAPDGTGAWNTQPGASINDCNVATSVTYSILWSTGDTTATVTGLAAGNYTVTVTSGTGCSDVVAVSVSEPTAINLSSTTTAANCSGSTGSVNLTVSGGTAGYTFAWSNSAVTEDISGLAAGSYTVTVTDGNGCTNTLTSTVSGIPSVSLSVDSLVNTNCGGNDGYIEVSATTGTAPFSFVWSTSDTTASISGLAAGTYTVTVTDDNNCSATLSVAIVGSSSLSLMVDNVINVSCNGANDGSIDISIIGDTSACSSPTVALNEVMYHPDLSNGVDPNTGEMIELIGPPGADISCYVLTDGDWTITIPQGTTIPADGLFTIGNDIVYGAGTFDLDAENCACFTEGVGGSALLILTDGGEYVSLFNGSGTFIQGLIFGAPSAANTPPDGASVVGGVISTAALVGCPASVTIPAAPYDTHPGADADTSIIRSPDGTGTWGLQADGGSINSCNVGNPASYSILWSTGDTTEDLSNLAAGTYIITVTDGNGCVATDTIDIVEPTALSTSVVTTTSACGAANGTVDLTVTGGTPNYTFDWNTGASTEDLSNLAPNNYQVTVTDANGCTATQLATVSNGGGLTVADTVLNVGCNGDATGAISLSISGGTAPFTFDWSNGSSSQNNSNLIAGTYDVTVTDNNGCQEVLSISVTEPTALNLNVDAVVSELCENDSTGSVSLSVTGGTSPYSYQWSNGSNSQDIANLTAATYYVTATDANGCEVLDSARLTPAPHFKMTVLTPVNQIGCDGVIDGFVQSFVAGGSGNISYLWSTGDTTPEVTGLNVGSYGITVTDGNGCSLTANGLNITAAEIPTADAFIGTPGTTVDTVIVNTTVNIGANVTNDTTIQWLFNPINGISLSSTTTAASVVSANQTGTYTLFLRATSPDGCQTIDTVYLVVIDNFLGMPDAFTPGNGDQLNDLLRPVNLSAAFILEFKVFDRFGVKVYDDPTLASGGWDGTFAGQAQPRDAYTYVLSYQLPTDAEPVVMRGQVMLIR